MERLNAPSPLLVYAQSKTASSIIRNIVHSAIDSDRVGWVGTKMPVPMALAVLAKHSPRSSDASDGAGTIASSLARCSSAERVDDRKKVREERGSTAFKINGNPSNR